VQELQGFVASHKVQLEAARAVRDGGNSPAGLPGSVVASDDMNPDVGVVLGSSHSHGLGAATARIRAAVYGTAAVVAAHDEAIRAAVEDADKIGAGGEAEGGAADSTAPSPAQQIGNGVTDAGAPGVATAASVDKQQQQQQQSERRTDEAQVNASGDDKQRRMLRGP
jgi:hypothetical protein